MNHAGKPLQPAASAASAPAREGGGGGGGGGRSVRSSHSPTPRQASRAVKTISRFACDVIPHPEIEALQQKPRWQKMLSLLDGVHDDSRGVQQGGDGRSAKEVVPPMRVTPHLCLVHLANVGVAPRAGRAADAAAAEPPMQPRRPEDVREERPVRTEEERMNESYGATRLAHGLGLTMLVRCMYNVMLPNSKSGRFGYQLSLDAGRCKHGDRKLRQITCVQATPKVWGVRGGEEWAEMAVWQSMSNAQSTDISFHARFWLGDDHVLNQKRGFLLYVQEMKWLREHGLYMPHMYLARPRMVPGKNWARGRLALAGDWAMPRDHKLLTPYDDCWYATTGVILGADVRATPLLPRRAAPQRRRAAPPPRTCRTCQLGGGGGVDV